VIICHVSFTVTSCELFGLQYVLLQYVLLQYVLLNLIGNFLEEKREDNIVKNSKRHVSKTQGETGFIV
jgi:hypothetical protein